MLPSASLRKSERLHDFHPKQQHVPVVGASAAQYRGSASKIGSPWCIAVWILEATDRMNINPLQLLRFSTILVSYKANTMIVVWQLLVYSRPNYTPNYNIRGLSPRANYTDRAAAAGRRS